MHRPYAESCEQNKDPILEVLRREFAGARRVLEIGSGTGQHAVHFARHLPHVVWQTSDRTENHPGIRAWLHDAALPNTIAPLCLDVARDTWPTETFDVVFSANTAHIMSWPEVTQMFVGVGSILAPGGVFCLYGPFNQGGQFTSESNARFDFWLRQRDPLSGLRDIDDLTELARSAGMTLARDHEMPANNRTLVWVRAPLQD